MDDDVETANLSQTEFGLLDASCVNLLPDPKSLSEGRWKVAVRLRTGCYLLCEHFL